MKTINLHYEFVRQVDHRRSFADTPDEYVIPYDYEVEVEAYDFMEWLIPNFENLSTKLKDQLWDMFEEKFEEFDLESENDFVNVYLLDKYREVAEDCMMDEYR